ncbi:MAG: hypothetical protein OXK80_06595 [Bdellovibrionales bacterium]|nr:hypothetical protein [Bdellovibrionales bacterium]
MKWFYMLILMFVISCGNDSGDNSENNVGAGSGNGSGNPADEITPEQAVTSEDVFAIQRETTEPVTLIFNEGSSNSVSISLSDGECIYLSSAQYQELRIYVGEPARRICGRFSSCTAGTVKIVSDNASGREPIEKPSNCRSVAS